HLSCQAGVVLTASHNPPEYNGYKVYWADGGQLVPPHDQAIIEEVNRLDYTDICFDEKSDLIKIIGSEVEQAYIELAKKRLMAEAIGVDQLKIVFTPIHGTSRVMIPKLLQACGFEQVHLVEAQCMPSGDFPTVKSPNPEEAEALSMAEKLAKEVNADVFIGTDPDADRLGVGVLESTDEFMQAVVDDTTYTHRWPIESNEPSYTKEVKARELWDTIINFVKNPFTKKAKFDFEAFYEATYEAQRLMDDLVELELEAIDRILAKVEADTEPDYIKANEIQTWKLLQDFGKRGRRTGLGFTAIADTIAAIGLKFDSDAALLAIDEIMQTKFRAEFDSSIDMAIERGAFKDFDPEIENQSEFVQMMQEEFPDIYERMMTHGRRNISISTVAPTGTLSMLAQTSSGIEPVYLTHYKRRRKVNPNDPNVNVSFIDDLGDSWEEFDVYHPKVKEWMDVSGNKNIDESPYTGATAPEIDWVRRVEMQALVQKYTTHSISSTINLPNDVSEEKVGEIYIESWKKGLKGITVYRDGSRSGVLVSADDKKKENKQKDVESLEDLANSVTVSYAPKRPRKLECDLVRFQNDYEKWLAVIGLLDGKPYEIFTGRMEDAFNLPSHINKGWVIKEKSDDGESRYDFQYIDKEGYRVTIEGLSRSFDKEFWNYAKLISGVLRHGMPIAYVVDLIQDLNLYDENINTWKNGVGRSLKRYIPDGTTVDKKCPNCGDPAGLVYEEGCLNCKSCGHSKCG
ncbi:unnamed protein product, partial [Cyprideis torosa]